MTDDNPAFSGELGHVGDPEPYERAIDVLRALTALLNTAADRESDPVRAGQLREDATRYATEQHQLRDTDRAAVQHVLSQYPPRVAELRTALAE